MNLTQSLLALTLTGVLLTSCKKETNEPISEVANENATTETVVTDTTATLKKVTVAVKPATATFGIEGMTCAMGCAKTIEEKLAAMDGVQKATVDFDKKTAIVEYDADKQTPKNLFATVEATADGKTYKVTHPKNTPAKAAL
jgi:mercuric ion binding protein